MGSEKLLFRLEQPHGSGDIYIAWQKGSGNYLATTGVDCMVNIFDRYGQIQDRIRLPSLCTGFAWDSDGDLLGIICSSFQLTIWDANNNKKSVFDLGLKDNMTCLIWTKTMPLLAVGTAKGNVSIYNHNTSKRTPIIGKHTKRITCGAWNNENLLALGSEDKTISISNIDGDTLRVINLRAEPAEIQFSEMKLDERVGGENTVSVVVGKRTLYLYNLLDPENPVELAFQQHYGSVISYKWFGDGYILIGFSSGYLIAISTHIKEVGQELFQIRNHKNSLNDVTICEEIGKAATCGDNTVKINDLSNLQETSNVLTLSLEAGLDRISWSNDGQLLAVCTKSGSLNVYVSNMPLLYSVSPPRIAILSSLTEVSLYNYTADKSKLKPLVVNLEIEPSFLSVGQYHLAAGMNNRVWFYDLTKPQPGVEDTPLLISNKQYLGSITSLYLNMEYASVLFEGKLQLHMIEPMETLEEREVLMFPEDGSSSAQITCHALTLDFLIYGTNAGQIVYFSMEEWSKCSEFKHVIGIKSIYVDPTGTRLFFLDFKSNGFVYNGIVNEKVIVPQLPTTIKGVIWDNNINDRNVFIVYDDHDIHTYVFVRFSIYGVSVKKVGQTTLVSKQNPLLMFGGEVMSAVYGGQLTQLNLTSHDTVQIGVNERDRTVLESNFNKQIALHRFNAAFSTCEALKSKELYNKLAKEALTCLEIDLALRVYRELENVSMVMALEQLVDVENYKLLSGHACMYLGEYDRAQEWFLSTNDSAGALAALEMRRDLLQWDQALELAKKIAPEQIALISREYAQQLEFTGNYSGAHMHYEKGLQDDLSAEHTFICKAGIARTTLHGGNFRHGISIALELEDKQLLKDCAEILEKKNQTAEAALLFERAQCYDRAGINYIKLKNWEKIGELLPLVSSYKLHLQYAKAKEAEGSYSEAVKAYSSAKDFDSVIRLQLDHLSNPEIAVELVQETKSVEGAKLVAKFFQKLNDYTSAIRFLIISKCTNEALELAKLHNKMELYGDILINSVSPDDVRPQDFHALALYFENNRNYLAAGKYWFHGKEYQKAMKHLLSSAKFPNKENEAITTAIDVVASSKNQTLANDLIEFLLGESDGIPKDPKYLFRLYMARKQFKEASKSALIIANEEQINGNYRNGHDVLYAMYQELKLNGIKIPYEMYYNLMLLHSYILVKLHVRRGDHLKGARMLIRVANNISKFPSHIVPILTSTVIECHRSGLKRAAFKYATILMNPEYRKNVDAKYSKKIEAVVRKPPKNGDMADPAEPSTQCPYCDNLVQESELFCNVCKNNIPFCIVTGRHIVASNLTVCPECDFPALRNEFIEILDSEDSCPMCSEKVDSRRLVKVSDPRLYLNLES